MFLIYNYKSRTTNHSSLCLSFYMDSRVVHFGAHPLTSLRLIALVISEEHILFLIIIIIVPLCKKNIGNLINTNLQ